MKIVYNDGLKIIADDNGKTAEYGCDFAHINQLVGAEAYFEDLRLQLIQEDRYVNAFCIF